MKLSILINELQKVFDTNGDLDVQIVSRSWEESSLPIGVMGGGGAGLSDNWHGTIKTVMVSKKYPNQIEIVSTK